ncbi:unnamed protein product (macronuclear) [Paramecium tetraurelia]|uniref:Uncharacterized protein n=1 Tax=Paramecium tetraurelia TaxID=5888 RepID=A0CAF7_PARTE|nr:uncharacterized protein GSPATT00036554001 [Paramecium tetraurelia]CAK67774.1 unnamed protein product [Paramecium tetraurelia]|eukprot:XP_001435171.1 hypothetical protein (macronuclear) [Paramecium tetraurelia strain d4-2]
MKKIEIFQVQKNKAREKQKHKEFSKSSELELISYIDEQCQVIEILGRVFDYHNLKVFQLNPKSSEKCQQVNRIAIFLLSTQQDCY